MDTKAHDRGSSHTDPHAADLPQQYSTARNWLISLPLALLLLCAIAFGSSAFVHGQLLTLGGDIWRDYSLLRVDMEKPTCDPNMDIDARMAETPSATDDADSLFDAGPVDPEAKRRSLEGQRNQCRQSFEIYRYNHEVTGTTSLRAFRAVELGAGRLNQIGQSMQSYILVALILLGGVVALLLNEHIGLRTPHSRLDFRVVAAAQLATNLAMAASAATWLTLDSRGAIWLNRLWLAAFALLSLASLYRLLRVPRHAEDGGSLPRALLSVPLYCWLALVSCSYFFIDEDYLAGPTVQLTKMIGFADLYTGIGLFVWVGMMLKHTRLAELIFGVLHSWELRPEFILILVVLAAAWPTAFTGASGIFVLAIGGVIYQELRIAGVYRQLAVASTAMSGSMGVVLSPCLMVVIIAALNRQVTTDQLYGQGRYVFALTAALFCALVYLTRKSRPHVATPSDALPKMLRALVPLVPYVLIGAAVVLVYAKLFGQGFDEFSAPVILPPMMLALLLYDRWRAKRLYKKAERGATPRADDAPAGFWNALRAATADTSMLIGALLILMVLSVVFGGMMERSGVMDLFPHNLGNVWLATGILVAMLVVIGMLMEPYGAIIMVSATLAPVAYGNGINAVHFWMIVLVAFELGYLTPPVALNQLLTRQVIGEAEIQAAKREVANDPSFWRRHESLLLPLAVLSSSLILVAFGPLVFTRLF